MMIPAFLMVLAIAPDWVRHGGTSPRFPQTTHVVGFAVVERPDALDQAKQAAAADLAARIQVRIESTMSDLQAEADGKQTYAVQSMTKASTDVRLNGMTYETHVEDGKTFALAIAQREQQIAEHRTQRDQALQRAEQLLSQGEKTKAEAEALSMFFASRLALAEALERDSIVRVLGQGKEDKAFLDKANALRGKADEHVAAILRKPVSSFKDLNDALALQLQQQGIAKTDKWTIPAPTYGTTDFSSAFGRQLSTDLDRALLAYAAASGKSRNLIVKGSYIAEKDTVRVVLIVRDATSGAGVASAEAAVPKAALGPELAFLPQNFQQAMMDQKLLGQGEEIGGSLRVELFTNKGSRNLVFANNEEMKLSMRVNKPCYVQLIYMLANQGMKVPLSQGYYIDESKVNRLVEFPDAFTVSAPFGVERVFAIASTEKPDPLPTKKTKVDGEDYDVVTDATTALVKHRGVKKKQPTKEIAETSLTLTTTPK